MFLPPCKYTTACHYQYSLFTCNELRIILLNFVLHTYIFMKFFFSDIILFIEVKNCTIIFIIRAVTEMSFVKFTFQAKIIIIRLTFKFTCFTLNYTCTLKYHTYLNLLLYFLNIIKDDRNTFSCHYLFNFFFVLTR